ncbi:MAG: hypothetical protein Q4C47_00160 [Planctomycetia bacterium]|nr:hypothetical protein [Planctomycetia bacterium]
MDLNPVTDPNSGESGRRSAGRQRVSGDDVAGYVIMLVKAGLVVVVAVCVFAVVMAIVRRRQKYDPESSLFELLEKAREQRERGELEPSEYEAIRGSVSSECAAIRESVPRESRSLTGEESVRGEERGRRPEGR